MYMCMHGRLLGAQPRSVPLAAKATKIGSDEREDNHLPPIVVLLENEPGEDAEIFTLTGL
jgi:hypothetical protein